MIIVILLLITGLILQYFYTLDFIGEPIYKEKLQEFRLKLLFWPGVSALAFITIPIEVVHTISVYVGWISVIAYFFTPAISVKWLKKHKNNVNNNSININ
jgi:hypothetical protein